jgi:hypothetical protein
LIAPLTALGGARGPNPQHPDPGPGPGAGPGPGHKYRPGHDSGNFYGVENLAYYGDWNSNRVFIIDIDNMSLLKTVERTGDGPYGVDQQGGSTAYALTRKTESVTVIENYFIENIGRIFLQHKPRSTHFNPKTGFSLVSGADKVMTSLIQVNSDAVTGVFGYDQPANPRDFGGLLATGHQNARFSCGAVMKVCCPFWTRPLRSTTFFNRPGVDTRKSFMPLSKATRRKCGHPRFYASGSFTAVTWRLSVRRFSATMRLKYSIPPKWDPITRIFIPMANIFTSAPPKAMFLS